MTGPFATRLFRIAFTLAGIYNLAFGLWATLWPLSFFYVFQLAPPRYPSIWACLGMVVGVYGFLYLHAAWKLETARPIIAVGLLGKILGPIGMLLSFSDDWPRRIGMLCIYNDLIWWLPFGLFLVRGMSIARWLERLAPWICIVLHVLGSLAAILFLRHGTLTEPNPSLRAAYIAGHISVWTVGWFLWMLSAMSFVGFCAWWGCRLPVATGGPAGARSSNFINTTAIVAVVLAACGTVFDFTGEGAAILLTVERAVPFLPVIGKPLQDWDAAAFISAEKYFTLCSAGVANLLYTIAGIILTLITPNMPTWIRRIMWATWAAGVAMTIAALFNYVPGLVISSVVLFPLMFVWIAWMGARWRAP